jgi:HEAT repeat protein
VPAIAARLASDEWTFVRAAAAAALAAAPADRAVDDALATALRDRAPSVREAAVAALAAHGAARARDAIRARLVDPAEEPDVRLAAARAVSALCDREAIDPLTDLARAGALRLASETDVQLGLTATVALGALHPADLAKRLAPLTASDARPESRAAAARALATPATCR